MIRNEKGYVDIYSVKIESERKTHVSKAHEPLVFVWLVSCSEWAARNHHLWTQGKLASFWKSPRVDARPRYPFHRSTSLGRLGPLRSVLVRVQQNQTIDLCTLKTDLLVFELWKMRQNALNCLSSIHYHSWKKIPLKYRMACFSILFLSGFLTLSRNSLVLDLDKNEQSRPSGEHSLG